MGFIEVVETLKYMGRMLDQSDNAWLAVHRNVRKAHRVWSQLGGLIQREGEDPRVSAMFYQAVVYTVLLFGEEIWVLLA